MNGCEGEKLGWSGLWNYQKTNHKGTKEHEGAQRNFVTLVVMNFALHPRDRVDVGAHHAHFIIFLRQVAQEQVTQGNQALEFCAFANGQVTEAVVAHDHHALFYGRGWADYDGIGGHDFFNSRALGVAAFHDDAAHQVALRENSREMTILQHRHRTDVVLHHDASDVANGLPHLGNGRFMAFHEIIDGRHGFPL